MFSKKYIYEWDNTEASFREENINKLPERRLWKAVILNAINDAMRKPTTKYCKINKLNALCWLLQDDNNFYRVCDLAGMSSQQIRTKLKPILEETKQ